MLLIAVQFSLVALAQGNGPLLRGSGKSLYIEHKVVAKDNFYSIGRLYNVGAKDIAAFNKLDMNKGLNIGQTVKIPLNATNFSQSTAGGTPIYYKLGEKEGLMKASAAANDVALEKLRKWNKLTNDKVEPGTKLIVGYLVNGNQQIPVAKETKEEKAPVVTTPVKEEKKMVSEPVVNQSPKIENPPVKETPKNPAQDLSVDVTPPKQEPKQEPIMNDRPKSDPVVMETPAGEGYFRSAFEKQLKLTPATHSETLTSGIFKTTSGWSDAKYYLLMDAVIAGTIVKITNPVNNRSIYAKVLGEMSGIRQNEGLNIRISNAAASALQITDMEKFVIKVNY